MKKPLVLIFYYCVLGIPATVIADDFRERLAVAAMERTTKNVTYSGAYVKIPYPNGDVPDDTGVCTDVVIRSYRALGIDLQMLVHEDMSDHFNSYPSNRIWGLKRPDTNIDHRRVPNLQVFFARNGISLPVTQDKNDYKPGELVTWMLPGNLPHIGIVSSEVASDGIPLIVHNIDSGPELQDMLFAFEITGHYQFDID